MLFSQNAPSRASAGLHFPMLEESVRMNCLIQVLLVAFGSSLKSRIDGMRPCVVTRIKAPWLTEGADRRRQLCLYVKGVLHPTLRPGDLVVIYNLGSHNLQGCSLNRRGRLPCHRPRSQALLYSGMRKVLGKLRIWTNLASSRSSVAPRARRGERCRDSARAPRPRRSGAGRRAMDSRSRQSPSASARDPDRSSD